MSIVIDKKLPSKAKMVTYLGVLFLVIVTISYIYNMQSQKKEESRARLQELIAQSGGVVEGDINSVQSPSGQPETNTADAPLLVEIPVLSDDIKALLELGAEKAKEQAKLSLAKVKAELKKTENENEATAKTDEPQGGFLLNDEMPVSGVSGGSGIAFNNTPTVESKSISSLTFRYASRIDGKLIAYVSIGEKGRMIEAKPGAIIDGIKITSISDTKLCASEHKISRCINMTY